MVLISSECSIMKFHSVITFCENLGIPKEIGILGAFTVGVLLLGV